MSELNGVKVSVQDVGKTFTTRGRGHLVAVDKISLDIHTGNFVSFLGPSGCGKSTLLRMIAGLETPTAGQILIDGRVVEGPQRNVGMVFQSYSLFPWLTVRQNVGFGLRLNGSNMSADQQHEIIDAMLDMIGLKDFANVYPTTLSGGMKQRVALARTLALRPGLLLLDEPFGALDAQTRIVLQDQLLDIWQSLDTTICFVTHDIEEALLLSDIVCVFSARPARIKKIVENPFPYPRNRTIQTDPEFIRNKLEIFELIKEDVYNALHLHQ
jgi:NitT/TauT family transport system ATP-binding protein